MAKKAKEPQWARFGSGNDYFHRSHWPLQCLIFIMPLLLIYQIGSAMHPWTPAPDSPARLVAFALILRFFALFGVVGNYLPMAVVVAVLLAWHLSRKDPWQFDPLLYLGRAAESFVWAMPILVFALVVANGSAMAATSGAPAMAWQEKCVIAVGAGVYEELLFRLVLITLLNMLLVDILGLSLGKAIPIIIVASAVLFSLYHYLGPEHFTMQTFFFRTAAGVYLAAIFIFRGFGIDVATHAAYDLLAIGLPILVRHG